MTSTTCTSPVFCLFGMVNVYEKSTVSPTFQEADVSVLPAFESMKSDLWPRSRATFLSMLTVLDLMVRLPRVMLFRVLVPCTGVPTIIGLPLESTTRYRPLSRPATVSVLPLPPTVLAAFTPNLATVSASCLAASRSMVCFASVGLWRFLSPVAWARSPAASKP